MTQEISTFPNLDKIFKTWEKEFVSQDWYLKIVPELNNLQEKASKLEPKEKEKLKEQLYQFFEQHLINYDINLGNEVGYWDKEREPIQSIIIHHTSGSPGMTNERLSAIELIRLYAPYYSNPAVQSEAHVKGKAISSGHVRNDRQVFWPYHWLVRTDGATERLLQDNEIGWQAGVWKVNCQSVAICLDNTYTDSTPSKAELVAIAKIVKENYPQISKDKILGHREVNPKSTCPSNLFLDSEKGPGWKSTLLSLL